MTHEELLSRLNSQIEGSKAIGCECASCDNALALRAVVELHRPKGELDWAECDLCDVSYPCETIQVIENELK